MKAKRIGTARKSAPSGQDNLPALPVWKAFVVQFSRETSKQAGTFYGRVEHLSSGRRARFASKQELVTALGTLLDTLGEEES